MPIDDDAAKELASRSRGTPRIANRIFKRVRDFALVEGKSSIDLEVAKKSLDRLKIDEAGLDKTDHDRYLQLSRNLMGTGWNRIHCFIHWGRSDDD